MTKRKGDVFEKKDFCPNCLHCCWLMIQWGDHILHTGGEVCRDIS